MVHIEDATNITLAFDEFRPSSQELKEVLSKCLSYYDLSLDKIDPEIFNVDDNFYVLSKQGNQYVVFFMVGLIVNQSSLLSRMTQ